MAGQFARSVQKTVQKFLAEDLMRSYEHPGIGGGTGRSVLEFERVLSHDVDILGFDALECMTWGHDHALLVIPTTYEELVRMKVRGQLAVSDPDNADDSGWDRVAYRFYYECMRQCGEDGV